MDVNSILCCCQPGFPLCSFCSTLISNTRDDAGMMEKPDASTEASKTSVELEPMTNSFGNCSLNNQISSSESNHPRLNWNNSSLEEKLTEADISTCDDSTGNIKPSTSKNLETPASKTAPKQISGDVTADTKVSTENTESNTDDNHACNSNATDALPYAEASSSLQSVPFSVLGPVPIKEVSVSSPSYLRKFTRIENLKQRNKYKVAFDRDYSEYKVRLASAKEVSERFVGLEELMNRGEDERSLYEYAMLKTIKEYKANVSNRMRFRYLQDKLAHIKKLIEEFDHNDEPGE